MDTDEYVKWNQLTRHQLIVAHMKLINACDKADAILSGALGTTPKSRGLYLLSQMAAEKIKEAN